MQSLAISSLHAVKVLHLRMTVCRRSLNVEDTAWTVGGADSYMRQDALDY